MPEFKRDPAEFGVLWEKVGAKGAYMTGKIGDVGVVAFKINKPEGGKGPDWRILKAQAKTAAIDDEFPL